MQHVREILKSLRGVLDSTSKVLDVYNWKSVGIVSGFPLGSWAGVPPAVKTAVIVACRDPIPKMRCDSSWAWWVVIIGLCLNIQTSPASWLSSLTRECQIQSSGGSSASGPSWALKWLSVGVSCFTSQTYPFPFVLQTDVLKGKDHLVQYISRKLSMQVSMYGTIWKEYLAIELLPTGSVGCIMAGEGMV